MNWEPAARGLPVFLCGPGILPDPARILELRPQGTAGN